MLAVVNQVPEVRAVQRECVGLEALQALQEFVGQISSQVNKIQNPVERAVEILYLTTKIHPFNNGNGRLTRFWASAVLMAAGYPPPVGLPTNDFLMSKNRLRLEVRKAVALGKLWKEMLQDAERRKVSAEEFFQKIYRSSGLEGLILYTPKTDSALEDWVTRLETIERLEKIPSWALKLNRDIEERIREVHKNGGNMANTNELEQFKLLSQISEKYPMAKPQVSRATRIPICQKAFLP